MYLKVKMFYYHYSRIVTAVLLLYYHHKKLIESTMCRPIRIVLLMLGNSSTRISVFQNNF